jgi:hypothetical protein
MSFVLPTEGGPAPLERGVNQVSQHDVGPEHEFIGLEPV